MNNCGEQHCRLCLSTISDERFKEINDVTKSIFDVLLLELNLDNRSKYIMCNDCSCRVMEAFRFKSMCVCTDNMIISYVDDETECSIDLKDIYMKQTGNKHLIPTLGDYKICRYCMQLVKDKFIPAQEMAVHMIKTYIPEINLNIVQNPLICKQCFDSFVSHSNFIINCLEVNKKIKSFCDTEVVDNSICMASVDSYIKTEEVDIKYENEQEDQGFETDSTVCKGISNKINHIEIKTEDKDEKSDIVHVTSSVLADSHKNTDNVRVFHTCDSSSKQDYTFVSKQRYNLRRNVLRGKYIYRTEGFPKSEYKKSLQKHQLIHKDISERKVFECDTCDFKTKYKKSLKRHKLIHTDISEAKVFECDACDYKTKRNNCLKLHQLKHKDISETAVYQCDRCDYKSKLKYYLKQHQLIHKDFSERKVFVCDTCGFKTNYKKNLKRHKLIHKAISETQVFECDACNYKTQRKDHLRLHFLAHKNISETEVFECDACDYKAKRKSNLREHLLAHKDISETEVFECDTCHFKTKLKNRLKQHLLTHKDDSETELFECHTCGHKFKQKHSLIMHIRREHSSETVGIECDTHNFKIFKG